MSPEELRALQEEADLRERRKRSPLVIFDALPDNPGSGSQPVARQGFAGGAPNGAASRQQALLEAIQNANGPGGIANTGARNLDTLDGRLEESPAPRVTATYLRDREYTIAQGKMIGGVIENAISSDLPGMVRAVVSETVYSEDGRNVLIEKGSRIVGEYRAGLQQGQARIFVIWNRVITPNGIDIQITSPGTDALGRSGLTGWIDSHFMERFGASIMLSIVGAAAAQQNDNQFNVELGQGFNESAEIALENSINIRPTLYKNQGDRIKIFIARDLNFRPVFHLRSQ
ncbi:MAG: type IV secretion system protein VirB10 [Planctomycetota bacterium]